MSQPEPCIPFRVLFAYTDQLAKRWFAYFAAHPAALDIDIGGQTGSLGNLVAHIVQVEAFFAAPQAPPRVERNQPEWADLQRLHEDAVARFEGFLGRCTEADIDATVAFGSRSVSRRKMLTQAALHSVHHWAQVAMAVRQAGFPAEKPQDFILSDVMD